ncbi:MAG: lipocalin family protein [Bdellovibrionaceae bacterium]|nr:lipocalin family protein [Pseudobdellovibrionaceae bacterium]
MRKLMTVVICLFSNLVMANDSHSELLTVPNVDLNQYVGKWYEIATIPQFFQRKCIKNTTAEYALGEQELVNVVNSCDKESGERLTAEGAARVVDAESNSKLQVTFVKLFGWIFYFGGDYWIVDLDEKYSYAVIGHPKREYAWILSRTPTMDLGTLTKINQKLQEIGYDSCKLMMSIQDGGNQKKIPLCEFLKN